MPAERNIPFTATVSKSRLTQKGEVRYQGQNKHNQVLTKQETWQQLAEYAGKKLPLVKAEFEMLDGYIAEGLAQGNRCN